MTDRIRGILQRLEQVREDLLALSDAGEPLSELVLRARLSGTSGI